MEPLMVVAVRGVPVKLTGVSPIVKLNSVPDRTGTVPVTAVLPSRAWAALGDKPSKPPPPANPCMNLRRDGSSRLGNFEPGILVHPPIAVVTCRIGIALYPPPPVSNVTWRLQLCNVRVIFLTAAKVYS